MLRRTHRLGGLDSIVRPEVAGALWPRRFGPDRRAWKVRARDLLVFDIELVNLKVAPSEAENAAATWTGVAVHDAASGELLSMTLVFRGVYRHWPPYDDPQDYAAVVEWRRR